MAPETLGVDADQLISLAGEMLSAAGDIPQAPPPFTTTGTDPISTKIMSAVSALEGPIQTGLPEIKAAASQTATDMGEAGRRYRQVDEELAKKIEDLLGKPPAASASGGSGAAGGGTAVAGGAGAVTVGAGAAGGESAAGGPGGADQMSQSMSVPMQLASQAAQIPLQALSALAAIPQGLLQGVQQVGQIAGESSKGERLSKLNDDAREADERERDEKREAAKKDAAEKSNERQPGAAAARSGERAPVAPPAPAEQPSPPATEPRHPAQTRPAEASRRLDV